MYSDCLAGCLSERAVDLHPYSRTRLKSKQFAHEDTGGHAEEQTH